jgi:hypothetical protein
MAFVRSGLWLGLVCSSVAGADTAELRYQFEPGELVVWECRERTQAGPEGQLLVRSLGLIRLWCLEQQQDESLVLLEWVPSEKLPVRGLVGYVSPRGGLRLPPVSQSRADELALAFYVLPAQAQDCTQTSWRTPRDVLGRALRCVICGPDATQNGNIRVAVEVEPVAGRMELLGRSISGNYWFDCRQNLITRVELNETGRDSASGCGTWISLAFRDRRDREWAHRRAEESRRFLQTLEHEDRLRAEVVRQPQQIDSTIDRLLRLWSARISDFDRRALSPFVALAEAQQAYWAHRTATLRRDAEYAQRWLGRRAVSWSLPDCDGVIHTSEQVRTGVTVECLWSASAPWVFSTLRSLSDRVDELERLNVRVLGLNLDADAEVAREVMRQPGPGMLQLLAGPLKSIESPPRLPVVRVLDRTGTIRHVMIGWHPSYAEAIQEARRLAR